MEVRIAKRDVVIATSAGRLGTLLRNHGIDPNKPYTNMVDERMQELIFSGKELKNAGNKK